MDVDRRHRSSLIQTRAASGHKHKPSGSRPPWSPEWGLSLQKGGIIFLTKTGQRAFDSRVVAHIQRFKRC